jgi:hypothetical protein
MNRLTQLIALAALLALAVSSCGPLAATATPTPTVPPPEPTKPPTDTPRPRATATATSVPPTPTDTPTATPTSPPPLPSPFNVTLTLSNGTCGSGTSQHPYTFTIDGVALSLLQVDASITTTGPYDPATGAFNTSAPVGPGTEYYTGTITYDGTLITVTGQSAYTQPGLECTNDIAGQTTP